MAVMAESGQKKKKNCSQQNTYTLFKNENYKQKSCVFNIVIQMIMYFCLWNS